MKQPSVWSRNKNGKDTELECVSPEGPFSGLLALKTSTSSLMGTLQISAARFSRCSPPMFWHLPQQMVSCVVVLVIEDI